MLKTHKYKEVFLEGNEQNMDSKLKNVNKILKKYKQEHLLQFFNEIDDKEKQENLLDEILNLNFSKILTLYKNSMKNDTNYKVTPIEHIEKNKLSIEELEKYQEIGKKIIKENSFAVVTMAGGQGTRLGYKGPKGTYEIKFSNGRKMSLFEIMCNNIKDANKKYNVTIPWYIMASKDNKEQTIEYFKQKEYFGYEKDAIKFFVQDTIPLIDKYGKIVLQDYYKIKEVSNGNGNVFKAMKNANIIKEMKNKGIKWASFAGIDNILLDNVDTKFLGMIIYSNLEIGSKSIFKKEPLDKIAVYCKKDGHPAILDYDEIDLKMSVRKNENGQYLYREANMLSHIMSLDAIKKVSNKELPYHRAYKKNPIINDEGVKIVPTEPNTFKFENFIFDSFKYFDDMFLLRVSREEEFAPIKDFTGLYTPETAKEAYERIYVEYGRKD